MLQIEGETCYSKVVQGNRLTASPFEVFYQFSSNGKTLRRDPVTNSVSGFPEQKLAEGVAGFSMLKDSPIWDFLASWRTPNTYSEQFDALPNGPGVYLLVLAIREDGILDHRVLYVGMSRNLANRHKGHEIKRMCQSDFQNGYIKVYFKHCPVDQLRTRERNLIKKLNPPYNIVHRRRGA